MMTLWRHTRTLPSNARAISIFNRVFLFLLAWTVVFEATAVSNKVVVSWSPSTDPSTAGYCLYYGTLSGNYTTRIDNGTNTFTTVSNLQGGVTYYFAATAYDAAMVESAPSAEAKVMISTNPSPLLVSVPGQFVSVFEDWSITNKATESGPGNKHFTYSLDPGAPAAMTIDPKSGVAYWTPQFTNAGSSYTVTVRATDNQSPPQSGTTTFNLVVAHAAQLMISSSVTTAGKTNSALVTFGSSTALTNLTLTLIAPAGRLNPVTVQSLVPQIATVTTQPAGANQYAVTVTGINGQSLPLQTPLFQVNFTAVAGQHSTFAALQATNVGGTLTDGSSLPTGIGGSGRMVLIGPETLVDAQQAKGSRTLVLYGNVGSRFVVQSTTNPQARSVWTSAFTGTITNQTQLFTTVPVNVPAIFYRAYTY